MARSTSERVAMVITVDSSIDLAIFIEYADVMVDAMVAAATGANVTLTTAEQEMIATYVAAHLYAVRDQQALKSKTGRSSTTYQGKTGTGLDSTFWGQTALALDKSGSLAALTGSESGEAKSAGIQWLGA